MLRDKLIAGILLVGGLFVLFLLVRPKTLDPIPSLSPFGVDDIMLADNAHYQQNDKRWGADRIGSTQDSLKAYGCTLTSVANAITNLTGQDMTPADFNTQMSEAGGFTDRGWLVWSKVSEITDGKITAKMYSTPDHTHIYRCLSRGDYPIVKIYLGGTIQHWVMVVGRRGTDYIVRDPLVKKDQPIALSSRGDKIHSVRCVGHAR